MGNIHYLRRSAVEPLDNFVYRQIYAGLKVPMTLILVEISPQGILQTDQLLACI